MKAFRNLICLTLIAVIASGAAMADEKKAKGKKGARKGPTATQRLVGKMDLTDEQKTQVAAIDKQFAERFNALVKKQNDILTDEQKAARKEMASKAKGGEKKTGPEARKAMEEALNLTDDQKAQQKELAKTQGALNKEIIEALKKVLTAEQQEKLPKGRGPAAGGDKPKKKKKDAA